MDKQAFEKLIDRFLSGEATEAEQARLESWYHDLEMADAALLSDEQLLDIVTLKHHLMTDESRGFGLPYRWIAVAALLLMVLSVGIYTLILNPGGGSAEPVRSAITIPPGGNKAILTLADGSRVLLGTTTGSGKVKEQGGVRLVEQGNGKLAYLIDGNNASSDGEKLMNNIRTPRGGQYQVTLSDGTRVWLNSASSISYPADFPAGERRVEVSGEVYMEVAHDQTKPFRVVSGQQTVEVLGTRFNINMYPDEPAVRTTLAEGSVRVIHGSAVTTTSIAVLKPGQQSILAGGNVKVASVDVEPVIAWKNGIFKFNKTNLREVTRQLSRWYDVDFTYAAGVSDRSFSGELARNANISEILDLLRFLDINFKLTQEAGRKVIHIQQK
ncbi:FecR family protein [Pedobacter deserti]|uniref:FecR family protein n=1 Tax=Pedobacter deserti TaxID=2817382 RepID=UPI00210E27BF|nr:FecR family protein [Pedobacter sp. SYSU D00382]